MVSFNKNREADDRSFSGIAVEPPMPAVTVDAPASQCRYIKFMVCMVVFVTIFPAALSMTMLSTAENLLRLICVDHDLPEHCTSTPEIRSLSEFNRMSNLVSQLPMLVSTALITTLADKIGRRPIMIVFLLGAILTNCLYALIVAWDDSVFRRNWRGFVVLAQFLTGSIGGFPVAVFCVFSMISEATADRPQVRGVAFALLQCFISVALIAGVQMSGALMEHGPIYVYVTAILMISVLLVVVVACLDETLPDEVRARPVDWRRANIVSALMFLVPSAHSRRLHAEDRLHTYEARCAKVYESSTGSDDAAAAAAPADGLDPRSLSTSRGETGSSCDAPADVESGQRRVFVDPSSLEALLEPAVDADLDTNADTHAAAASDNDDGSEDPALYFQSPAAQKLIAAGLPLPTPPLPRGNALIVFAAMVFMMSLPISGEDQNYMPYLKQTFNISDTVMSNVSTIESCAKIFGAVVFFRAAHSFVTTRWGEMRALQLLLCCVGLFNVCLHFCKQLWQVVLLKSLGAACAVVPGGFIRGLLSTEVGALLQGKVLAAVAAVEVITGLFGTLTFTSIFAATNESSPTLVFVLGGLMVCVASAMPFLVTDSRAAFDARRPPVPQAAAAGAAKSDAEHDDSAGVVGKDWNPQEFARTSSIDVQGLLSAGTTVEFALHTPEARSGYGHIN